MDDYADFFVPSDHPAARRAGAGGGRHRGPVETRHPGSPTDPLDSAWDPVEEMTYLLQDAVQDAAHGAGPDAVGPERAWTVPRPRGESAPHVTLTGDPMDNLATITAELPAIRSHPAGHRKVRVRKVRFTWLQTVSFLIAALAAVVVSMVSVFGGMVSYIPLRHVAFLTQSGTAVWWPLLVYGPWTVASLSVLRAALHQRRAAHSWAVVLLFSSVAMALCAAQADRTFTGVAAAVLPAVAALACFQQLVRQITMTRPARQSLPRHRLFTSTAPRAVLPVADPPAPDVAAR
ncbi:DUF2637 domain-containing protein [Streptomyces dioscori]|uniref:DUF2637 domain-containing protein n=1 Tax=Streptomyces dioscori TaxID=2109333 RepID=A0A2P8QAW1_9ACTN|nr:DUF2637 domain-containing protein [Streptomyces dioscori]PSM43348.1 DUF2637 domain-containing protein [Streptomyces dioscori]